MTTSDFDGRRLLERFSGAENVLRAALEIFLEMADEQLLEIRTSIEKKNSRNLELRSHTLKGNASNFLAVRMVELTDLLEKRGKAADFSDCQEIYIRLENELNLVLPQLRELLLQVKADE